MNDPHGWRPITELTAEAILTGPVEIWRGTYDSMEGEPYPTGGWSSIAWAHDRWGWVGTTNKKDLRAIIRNQMVKKGWTHWRHVSPPPFGATISSKWNENVIRRMGESQPLRR